MTDISQTKFKRMYLYKDCSDLPIWNFHIVKNSNDFRFLVVDYDGYSEIKVPKGANERWQAIRNEWIRLIGDNEVAYFYDLILESVYLQTRYNVVKGLLERMFVRDDMVGETLELYIGMLSQWRFFWKEKLSKNDNIEKLLKQLKASQNKISLKLSEIEDLKVKYEANEDDFSLEKQKLIIEQSTGIKIDLKKDSVKTWIEACKMHQDMVEQRRKANGK